MTSNKTVQHPAGQQRVEVPPVGQPPVPPTPADPIEGAIRNALSQMLQGLRTNPPATAPLTVRALRRQAFEVVPPSGGFAIANPVSAPGQPATLTATPEVTWELKNSKGAIVAEGNGFDADPEGLDALLVRLMFLPQIAEDRAGVPTKAEFALQARVRLSVQHPVPGDGRTFTEPREGTHDLPAIPIEVPVALLVPTVLAFFRHRAFAAQEGRKPGFALVYVPRGSRFANDNDVVGATGRLQSLVERAQALQQTIAALPSADRRLLGALPANLNGYLLGLTRLVGALAQYRLAARPPVEVFLNQDSQANLNDLEIIRQFIDDVEGENEISALIFIGPKDKVVRCYNKRRWQRGQGILRIQLRGQMCSVIERLDRATPPATLGDAAISTPEPANFALRADTFENALASFHFGETPPA